MKVSIGAYLKDGPWGGGNLFFKNLKDFLEKKNHKVVNHLLDDDIDLILLTDPRKESESSSFTHEEIVKYKNKINSQVKVVHRINECDERKNTKGLNQFIYEANKCTDSTVFVSNWIKKLYYNQGFELEQPEVIMSGSNANIFNSINKKEWGKNEKLKIVTHHWGGNWNKGFDVYQLLDELLDDSEFSSLFEFTYIGNIPINFTFKNTRVIKPLSGKNLAEELKKNHVYITGSLNEPSGNHHIEGAMCGLPVLFINSGALPEYCGSYGIEFDIDNLQEKIYQIKEEYFDIIKNLRTYPFNSDRMCEEYESLFIKLIEKNENKKLRLNKINFLEKLKIILKRFIYLNFYNLFKKNKLWK